MSSHQLGPTAKLDGFTITNGSASYGGGMNNWWYSSPTVTDCTFSDNSARSSMENGGGGIYNFIHSSPTVTNCIFSGNSAGDAGVEDEYRALQSLCDRGCWCPF